jgi:methionine-rich copper-binding protein CopC
VSKLVALVALVLALAPSSALAHSEIVSTDPPQGARLGGVPKRIVVRFSQAPSDARLRVRDGCDRGVARKTFVRGSTASVRVRGGQPGRWRVVVDVISSADEHISRDRFALRVTGRPRCSDAAGSPAPAESPTRRGGGDEPASGTGSGPASGTGDGAAGAAGGGGASTQTIVTLVAGAIVVAGIAGFVLRAR